MRRDETPSFDEQLLHAGCVSSLLGLLEMLCGYVRAEVVVMLFVGETKAVYHLEEPEVLAVEIRER